MLTWLVEVLSSGALVFKIIENLLKSKRFYTSRKLLYFEQNQLSACLIYVQMKNFSLKKPILINIKKNSSPPGLNTSIYLILKF